MNNITFLMFRRMRAPLLALITTYSVAILGFVVIPGQDAAGNPWHMDFFHAFYFVSFMATTIGFGEIPFEFTAAQRMWATFSIYATVISWVYAIGRLIALVQDSAFQQAMTERRFARRVRRLREHFYLVCGYGDTGSALVEALTEHNQNAVVVEVNQDRVDALRMQNLRQYVPALCGDARRPVHLLQAGLKHPLCAGVVALTNLNEVNLKIAITSKLLHGALAVICRADSRDIEANMASFGTEYIIDPFETFATHLATALQAPSLSLLHEWLSSVRHEELKEPVYPPADGLWVVCSYGRFGKAVCKRLRQEGIEFVVVEAEPEHTGTPEEGFVVGRGTEADTLQQARIERAVGLVAGTDDDANNLSIIMTAKALNPNLFVILRQNLSDNQSIIDAVQADMVMHAGRIIATKIRVLLATPMLHEFIELAFLQDEAWACELISRISGVTNIRVPEVWEVELTPQKAYAVHDALTQDRQVRLGEIGRDPRQREFTLPCIPLLLVREGSRLLLPAAETRLQGNDRLLFCGRYFARTRMEWSLENQDSLNYILTGEAGPQSWLWRALRHKPTTSPDTA